jgi:plastocyanin
MMIRIRQIAVALVLVAAASACGSSSSGGTAPPAGSGSSGTTGNAVTIKGFAFHPATLTVKVGTKVTFTNNDNTTHTTTATTNGGFDSGNLSPGQSYTFTFTKKGTYPYDCTIHNFIKGTIIVQ